MTWAPQQHQQHVPMLRTSSGFACQPQAFQQLQTALSAPVGNLSNLAGPPHQCTRFCTFQHSFGNVYVCVSSGAATHLAMLCNVTRLGS